MTTVDMLLPQSPPFPPSDPRPTHDIRHLFVIDKVITGTYHYLRLGGPRRPRGQITPTSTLPRSLSGALGYLPRMDFLNTVPPVEFQAYLRCSNPLISNALVPRASRTLRPLPREDYSITL